MKFRSEGHHFRLFAISVTSDLPLTALLPRGDENPSLILRVSSRPLVASNLSDSNLLYSGRDKDGRSLVFFYRTPAGEILSFVGAGDFLVRSDDIEGYSPDWSSGRAELRLLGPVLSYWFERRGLPTFHASAVSVEGHAIAFLSRHGGGKSGLAAGLVTLGASLLTDDLLVSDEQDGVWKVRPSYPLMRMWPDEAEYFLGSYAGLPRVQENSEKRSVAVGEGGFGTFHDAARPLTCIYLATRVEGMATVEIQPVSRGEALIELVRHSFSPRLMEAVGLQPPRLARLARLVQSVPVRRLVYPSGFERLEEVASRILKFGGTP